LRFLALSLALLTLAPLVFLLFSSGFPAFEIEKPLTLVPSERADKALTYLIWEDRFPDMLAQAALALLAAAACISAVRLWRGRP